MKKSRRKKQSSFLLKFLFIFLFIFGLYVLIHMSLYYFRYKNVASYENLLKNSNYDIVYQIDNVPVINIAGTSIDDINLKINEDYQLYVNQLDGTVEYEYNVSEDCLSILLIVRRIIDGMTFLEYKSYNVDLYTLNELSYQEILDKFEITQDDLKFYLQNKLFNYYEDLLNKKMLDKKKCDFNCFIYECNIEGFDNTNTLYINKNHLVVYNYFNVYNDFDYSSYFTEDSFRFNVK